MTLWSCQTCRAPCCESEDFSFMFLSWADAYLKKFGKVRSCFLWPLFGWRNETWWHTNFMIIFSRVILSPKFLCWHHDLCKVWPWWMHFGKFLAMLATFNRKCRNTSFLSRSIFQPLPAVGMVKSPGVRSWNKTFFSSSPTKTHIKKHAKKGFRESRNPKMTYILRFGNCIWLNKILWT